MKGGCRFEITGQVIKAYHLRADMQTQQQKLILPSLTFKMFTRPDDPDQDDLRYL